MKDHHIKICFITVTIGFLVMVGAFGVLTQRMGQLVKWHMELEQEVRVLRNQLKTSESNRQALNRKTEAGQALARN